ncbi:MAG: UDP-N-acetylmuramate dehydrogenase [Bacilli bacterium]|nr:UDP-N-acetylmuramate dehydrogenase [Bacilli bacterium]
MHEYGELLENVNLKKYNTYKIGGHSKYLIKPYNIKCLKNLIEYLKNNKIKYIVLGKGSNVILPDEDYDGTIILLEKLNKIEIENNIVNAESGILLNTFINKLINNNLGGLENLYGIPGTLGGAIVQNAGCYSSEISDYIESITYLKDNEIKTINKEDCDFSYRDSIFKKDKDIILLSASFKLYNKDKKEMKEIIKNNMNKRKSSQPLEYPNAGSVFRNPKDLSAGKLIDDLNLKGYHINDAYISNKHANFIINKGNSSSEDIKLLIEHIKKEIYKNYKIELILEQEIVKY